MTMMATPTAVHKDLVPCPDTTSTQSTRTHTSVARRRPVVAVVLEWRDHVLLLKRSAQVSHDQGKWHCVTGYIETGRSAVQQAADELFEETGLRLVDLTSLEAGPVLSIRDAAGQAWQVHTFAATTMHKRLTLNWEHETYRWVAPRRVGKFDGRVQWLDDVIRAAARGDGRG